MLVVTGSNHGRGAFVMGAEWMQLLVQPRCTRQTQRCEECGKKRETGNRAQSHRGGQVLPSHKMKQHICMTNRQQRTDRADRPDRCQSRPE